MYGLYHSWEDLNETVSPDDYGREKKNTFQKIQIYESKLKMLHSMPHK